MKLLLTSAGITNGKIAKALGDLLGQPFDQSCIVVIPTGHNPVPGDKGWLIEEDFRKPYALGWKEFSVVDLAAVSELPRELWWPQLERADVLLVGGGDTFYLSYWLQRSGVFAEIQEWLRTKVYVGISAGSQVAGASLRATSQAIDAGRLSDDEYDEIGPKGQSSAAAMRLVNFHIRPHLNSPHFPKIRHDYLAVVSNTLDAPLYALDDQSALKVSDDSVEVVTEGSWHLFD